MNYASHSSVPRRRKRRGFAFFAECILWVCGYAGLGYFAYSWAESNWKQVEGEHELAAAIEERPLGQRTVDPRKVEGGLVGRIEIPRLHLSAVIFEGTTDSTLAGGVGHMSSSTTPGQHGNVVLAGHRDTFFRPLQRIREGDQIQVTTPEGVFSYVVESTEVTQPDDVKSIRPTSGAVLTLVTCYPFHYIGSAPERFIVRGRAVSKLGDSAFEKPLSLREHKS